MVAAVSSFHNIGQAGEMVMDEFEFIRSLLTERPVFGERIVVDVGDDAAVVQVRPGNSLIMTCDTMVESVHFLRQTMRPSDIGWKLLASNLSDLAAMGATPTYALCAVALPPTWSQSEIKAIFQGMYRLAEKNRVTLIGGDTVRAPDTLVLTCTLVGEVPDGKALLRSATKPGDLVFVTGTLGDAAAGLHLLLEQPSLGARFPTLISAHQRPEPQLEIGNWLMRSGYQPACDDVSDGLGQEAWEIAEASGVCLLIEQAKLPISDKVSRLAAQIGMDAYEWAWSGGEDYQLLGTICAAGWEELRHFADRNGFLVTVIGRVEAGEACVIIEKNGKREKASRSGYNHFRK
jgi:thiamine-monophosphate kinase